MPQFDVAAAKKAGYTDAQIADFLASEKGFDASAAREAGYDDAQLVSHLLSEAHAKNAEDLAYDPKTRVGKGPRYNDQPKSSDPRVVAEPTPFRGYDPQAMAEYEAKIGTNRPTVLGTEKPDETRYGSFGRGLTGSAVPTATGGVGAVTGGAIGALFGPLAPVTVPLGMIGGGILGGVGGNALQEEQFKRDPLLAYRLGQGEEQRRVDEEKHPGWRLAGQFLPGFALGRPQFTKDILPKGAGLVTKVLSNPVTGNLAAALLGGGVEAAAENVTGEQLDPAKIAVAAGMTAAQRKGWGLGNFDAAKLSPLQESLLKSKSGPTGEATDIVNALKEAGASPAPYEFVDPGTRANIDKAISSTPQISEIGAKYAEGVQTQTPSAGQGIVSQLAPTDARTAEQAASEAAKDIAEHPDVVAAKPDVVSGEAGSKIHEVFNDDLDARTTNMNATYKKAEEGGKTLINPSVATPADLSSRLKAAFDPHAEIFGDIDIPASAKRFNKMSSFLTDANELDVGQIFKMRKQLNAVIGGKPGSPDAAAAKDLKKVLDGFMDEVVDAPDGLVGDPNTVSNWKSAIGQRREIGQLYQGNDVVQDITEREFRGGKKVPKMAADFVSKRLLGSMSGTKDQVKDLTALRDRLGENDPKWIAIQKEGLAKVLGKDFGTKNFGAALKKFESENPALAKLFISDEDRIKLTKGQGVVSEAVGRQGAQSAASNIMSTNPTDFANSVSAMSKAALRDARVAARQVFRDAMNRPGQSAGMLEKIATGKDTQDNIIALFGEDEGRKLIRSSKALSERYAKSTRIKAAPVEAQGKGETQAIGAIVGSALGAKMGPIIEATKLLLSLGVDKKRAEQLATDAFDPNKADETLAFIEKLAGKSGAQKLGDMIAHRVAKRDSTYRNVTRTVGSLGQQPPAKQEKPEEKAKEPEGSTTPKYDVDYLASKIESHEGLGKNPTSSAVGPFQFVSGTLAETYNQMHPDQEPITPEEADAMRSSGKITDDDLREMGKFHTQKNIDFLVENDLPITAANVYLMHFAGRGATPRVIAAEPTAPISDVLSRKQINDNSNIEFEGKRFPDFTVQDLRDWANDVML